MASFVLQRNLLYSETTRYRLSGRRKGSGAPDGPRRCRIGRRQDPARRPLDPSHRQQHLGAGAALPGDVAGRLRLQAERREDDEGGGVGLGLLAGIADVRPPPTLLTMEVRLADREDPLLNRTGRFRLRSGHDAWVVRYRCTPTTLAVSAHSPTACLSLAWRLRLGRRPSLRYAARWTLDGGRTEARTGIDVWDLQAAPDSPDGLGHAFEDLLAVACPKSKSVTTATVLRKRRLMNRLLRQLAREAFRRTDPTARQLAGVYAPELRFRIYKLIVADPTGRVGQMVSVCPGLLGLIAGLRSAGPAEQEAARHLLAGITGGRRLPQLLESAARASLSPAALRVWALGEGVRRLAWARPSEFEAAVAARKRLTAKAGSLVDISGLFAAPPLAFALEDIPRDPVGNARWYSLMRNAGLVLFNVSDIALREPLSAFVSANALLIASRAWRLGNTAESLIDVDGPGVFSFLQRLVRFAGATGRRPSRATNALKYFEACAAWTRQLGEDSAAGRLGRLLRRIPLLDLGEVTAVHALTPDANLEGVQRVRLPRGPLQDVSRPGLVLAQLRSPEALASEGWTMGHCVGSWVPKALSGEVAVYAGKVGGQRLTVAFKRSGRGSVVIVDARRAANAEATAAQKSQLNAWVAEAAEASPSKGERQAG